MPRQKVSKSGKNLKQENASKKPRDFWIEEAILAYVESLSYDDILQKIEQSKYLNISLDSRVEQKIAKKLSIIKSLGGNYTKKMIIIEAIEARISKEEPLLRQLIESNSPELLNPELAEVT